MNKKIIIGSVAIIIFLLILAISLRPAKLTIVVDAGHGGEDPGTISPTGIYEKDINLAIAKKIAASLAKNHYKVIMLRQDDSTLSLEERYTTANAQQADFFISVHANAIENSSEVEGIQVLYYPDSEQANEQLAQQMLKQLTATTKAVDKGVISRPDLAVLRGTTMKSLLIETGFMTNEQELARLLQNAYQQKIADAVTKTVNYYMKDQALTSKK
ncbi:MAG TPA: N-acetylmuramoyl-L-alanine amidase [Metalysinibacillus sp.]